MNCNCGQYKWVRYEDYDEWTGEKTVDEKWELVRPQTEDISLHSYKCTGCGKISYYSARGEEAEKNGTEVFPGERKRWLDNKK